MQFKKHLQTQKHRTEWGFAFSLSFKVSRKTFASNHDKNYYTRQYKIKITILDKLFQAAVSDISQQATQERSKPHTMKLKMVLIFWLGGTFRLRHRRQDPSRTQNSH